MAGKTLRATLKVIVLILIYLMQIYVINNTTFFGITGDLCLMAVVITALIDTNLVACIVAIACGILSDLLFSAIPCKYLIIYLIVTVVLLGLKKMYKQDSKIAIIIFATIGVAISEIFMYIFNVVQNGIFVNIFSFFFVIIKGCILNICFAYILHLVFRLLVKEG